MSKARAMMVLAVFILCFVGGEWLAKPISARALAHKYSITYRACEAGFWLTVWGRHTRNYRWHRERWPIEKKIERGAGIVGFCLLGLMAFPVLWVGFRL